MHPACPNKKPNHLQNSFLRRTQFWVRKTFSKLASLKRASLVALPAAISHKASLKPKRCASATLIQQTSKNEPKHGPKNGTVFWDRMHRLVKKQRKALSQSHFGPSGGTKNETAKSQNQQPRPTRATNKKWQLRLVKQQAYRVGTERPAHVKPDFNWLSGPRNGTWKRTCGISCLCSLAPMRRLQCSTTQATFTNPSLLRLLRYSVVCFNSITNVIDTISTRWRVREPSIQRRPAHAKPDFNWVSGPRNGTWKRTCGISCLRSLPPMRRLQSSTTQATFTNPSLLRLLRYSVVCLNSITQCNWHDIETMAE